MTPDEQPLHPGWGVVSGTRPRQQRGSGPTYRRSQPGTPFATVLGLALEETRTSQSALARRLDVDPSLINRIVTGKQHPSLWMLSRLVDLLPGSRKRLIDAALAGATRPAEAL